MPDYRPLYSSLAVGFAAANGVFGLALTTGGQETVASNGTSKDSFTFGGDPNSLDPKERERAEDLRKASLDAVSLEITIADEVFEGVKVGGTKQRATSKDQNIENSFQDQNFEGLPFDSSGTFIDIADDNLAVLAGIINTSTDFAFDFTALSLFTGLDHTFFTPMEFDSLEAIASGILTLDLISDVGVNSVAIPKAGGEANSVIYLSGEFIDPSGYFLVTGTARPIITDGTFGEEVNFSFGARRISEPPLLSLLIFGLAALVFSQRRGRMTLRVGNVRSMGYPD